MNRRGTKLNLILALKNEMSGKLKSAREAVRRFKKGVEKTSGAFNKLGNAKRALGKVRGAALVASGAIAGVGTASVMLAKHAGKYESIRDSFEGMTSEMGISAEKFEKKVGDASAGTLDRLSILQGATQSLSLIGKEAFSDFEGQFAQMAEYSKKAARATGQSVDYMFESLITGVSRSSKKWLDNLGITVDVTTAQKEFAEQLGKTRSELTQSEEKQALLNAALSELEENYKNVKTTSGGFSGAMQGLNTTLANAKIEIGQELIPGLNNLVRQLTPLIKKYVPILADKIKGLFKWFQNLSPTMKKIIGLLVVLAPAIVVISTVLMPVLTVIQALIPIVGGLAAVLGIGAGSLIGILGLAAVAIGSVVTAGVLLVKHWDDVKWAAGLVWEAIKNAIQKRIDKIKDAIQSVKDFIRGLIDKFNILKQKIKNIRAPKINLPNINIRRPSWMRFQRGGIVPGPIGRPIPAIVHGGERVIPANQRVGSVNVYIQGGNYLDREAGEKFAEYLGEKLRRELRL